MRHLNKIIAATLFSLLLTNPLAAQDSELLPEPKPLGFWKVDHTEVSDLGWIDHYAIYFTGKAYYVELINENALSGKSYEHKYYLTRKIEHKEEVFYTFGRDPEMRFFVKKNGDLRITREGDLHYGKPYEKE